MKILTNTGVGIPRLDTGLIKHNYRVYLQGALCAFAPARGREPLRGPLPVSMCLALYRHSKCCHFCPVTEDIYSELFWAGSSTSRVSSFL